MTFIRQRLSRFLAQLLKRTGLDFLPIILGTPLPPLTQEKAPSQQELETLFLPLDSDHSEEVLNVAINAFERQSERIQTIETKASSLMGFTGAGLALGSSLALFMMDASRQPDHLLLNLARVLFVLMLASYVCAIVLANRVIAVNRYRITAPTTDHVTTANQHTVPELRALRSAALLYSERCNDLVAREKATYLIGAQLWFHNALFMLVLLAGFLAFRPLLQQVPPSDTTKAHPANPAVQTSTVPTRATAAPPPAAGVPPPAIPATTAPLQPPPPAASTPASPQPVP